MSRIEWLKQKHANRVGRVGNVSKLTLKKDIFMKSRQIDKHYKLDIFAPIPKTIKPCGFYGDTLTEACYLPYKDEENNVVLRPTVIMAKKDLPKHKPYKLIDFLADSHNIKGTFPSRELQTLMSVKAVQMLEHIADVEPRKVDEQIERAFNKHLDIPKPEMILAKRWIEGTFFYDVFDAFPIESILGVSESGKSRLCMLNLALCYHAEGLIDPTEATIFRAKEEDRVSLIVDEAEYLNYSYLRAILNMLVTFRVMMKSTVNESKDALTCIVRCA